MQWMFGQFAEPSTSMGGKRTNGHCEGLEYERTPQICPGPGRYGIKRDASAIRGGKISGG